MKTASDQQRLIIKERSLNQLVSQIAEKCKIHLHYDGTLAFDLGFKPQCNVNFV